MIALAVPDSYRNIERLRGVCMVDMAVLDFGRFTDRLTSVCVTVLAARDSGRFNERLTGLSLCDCLDNIYIYNMSIKQAKLGSVVIICCFSFSDVSRLAF